MYRTLSELPRDMPLDLDGYLAQYGTGEPGHVDPDHDEAYQDARAFLRYCERNGRHPRCGFTLHGALGAGKTTLMTALGRSLVEREQRVLFLNWPDLRQHVVARWEEGSYEEWLDRLGREEIAGVLLLDEVGQESPTPHWVEQFVAPLFRLRGHREMPVIMTTTVSRADLAERWSCDGRSATAASSSLERFNRSGYIHVAGGTNRTDEKDYLEED